MSDTPVEPPVEPPPEPPVVPLPPGVEFLVVPDPTQLWSEESLVGYYNEHPDYRPEPPPEA